MDLLGIFCILPSMLSAVGLEQFPVLLLFLLLGKNISLHYLDHMHYSIRISNECACSLHAADSCCAQAFNDLTCRADSGEGARSNTRSHPRCTKALPPLGGLQRPAVEKSWSGRTLTGKPASRTSVDSTNSAWPA